MRLKYVTFVILISCMHVCASGHAQRVSLSLKDVTMLEVMDHIEKQTGYSFWLQTDLLKDRSKVTMQVKNAELTRVLNQLLKKHQLRYTIVDKTIVIAPIKKEALPADLITRREPVARLVKPTEHEVSGQVVDENGMGLPGVNVVIKGSQRGVSTDIDGRFSLALPSQNTVLVFSFVGYLTQEVVVGTRSSIEVAMVPDTKALEELVVIGYGVVKKSDLTGAVSQVKAKELNAFPNANVLQSLSGRASGVHIRQSSGAPGATMNVRVRGGNSILGKNEPLYVIDGFPINGNPTHLNNSDIESLEILKDASSTAIYGSRGSNGVVMITTKRGKSGRTHVDFETSYTSQKLIRKLELMNAREYAEFYNMQAVNDNIKPYFTQDQINSLGEGFDWQDFVFQKAPLVTSSLNINGGNEKTLFSVAGSVFGQQGIVKGSSYNRYSLQTNLSHKVSDKFTIDLASTISKLHTERKDSGGGSRGSSMIAAAISAPPTLTPYNEDGSYTVLSTAYPFIATDIRNPINFINEQKSAIRANAILANLGLSYKITPDLILKVTGGIENRDDRTDNYTTRKFFNSDGIANVTSGQFTSLLNENTLNYYKSLGGKHHLNAMAGVTFQNFTNTSLGAGGTGFLSDIFESYNLQSAANQNIASSSYTRSVIVSYLGRVNYTYDDRYLVTASLRRDGTSVYSAGSKWGYFPSAALAWRISNEAFMTDQALISDLKIRTSWGGTGSQAVDPYSTMNNLAPNRTIFNDEYATTFAPGTTLPGHLKWETSRQFDVGVDLGLWDNRIFFTADYYLKTTRDLLSVVALPSSLGYTSTRMNVGSIENKGIEFNVDAALLRQGKFSWDLNANISFNKSRAVSLYGGEDILRDNLAVIIVSDATSILREGRPVGQFWGYREAGYDENGFIKFEDLNNDGTINQSDKTYIGDPNPNFIYGVNSTWTYQGFELNMFWQGSQGNDIFNASAITNTMDYGFGLNMPRAVFYNHWTPEAPNADYPKISLRSPVRVSDRFIEDGSYFRMKNISLGYNLKSQLIKSNIFRTFHVYISGQNLLTFTKYSWWDPETNFRMDHNSYPVAKSLTAGLRVGF